MHIMAMELSIWSSYYIELSPEDAILRLKQNGLNSVELSDEHGLAILSRSSDPVSEGRKFGEYAKSIGMDIPQGHLWLRVQLVRDENAIERMKQWLDLFEAIGIKNMVLHIDNCGGLDYSKEDIYKANAEKLKMLTDYIGEREIFICLENLIAEGTNSIDDLLAIIDMVGSDKIGITLDTGHLNVSKTSSQKEFIYKAGKKLRALHIADNEGASDQHLMPYGKGNVDFDEVISALRDIGYEGILNYEIPGENRCPIEVRDMKTKYVIDSYGYLMNK